MKKNIIIFNIIIILSLSCIIKASGIDLYSSNKNKIYPEDIILELINYPDMLNGIKFDRNVLPYIIYSEILFPERQLFNNIEFGKNWLDKFETDESYRNSIIFEASEVISLAKLTKGMIEEKFLRDYNLKYNQKTKLDIKEEDLTNLIKKGKLGDLDSIYKLIQYYENPKSKDYNPEQYERNYWLFQAIKFDSKEALLEVGYEYPYSTRAELRYKNTLIRLDTGCEKLIKVNHFLKPACFIYKLEIKNKSNNKEYIVIDDNSLSGNSIVPQKISIVKNKNNEIYIELTSYSDNNTISVRTDFFSLAGDYLFSNSKENTLHYFWNFRKATLINNLPTVIDSKNFTLLDSVTIRKLPYKEAILTRLLLSNDQELKALDNFNLKLDLMPLNEIKPESLCQARGDKNFIISTFLRQSYKRLSRFFHLISINDQIDGYSNKSDIIDIIKLRKYRDIFYSKFYCGENNSDFITKSIDNLKIISKEYLKLDDFTYLIPLKTEIPELDFLLVCSGLRKERSSCYALQARYIGQKIKNTYYFISDEYTTILFPYAYKALNKNNKTYIFIDYLSCNHGRDKQLDVFDDSFNHLGIIYKDYYENILYDDNLFASVLNHDTKEWSDCMNVYKHFYPDPIDVLIEKARKEFLYINY
ncbi:MAG: hypothetical protein LBT38_00070 [Deltaproteobacteria bacterium]|jgi:hypothetical protein|nr:hypothetical protein [Deltaproteobacteria bacterium]